MRKNKSTYFLSCLENSVGKTFPTKEELEVAINYESKNSNDRSKLMNVFLKRQIKLLKIHVIFSILFYFLSICIFITTLVVIWYGRRHSETLSATILMILFLPIAFSMFSLMIFFGLYALILSIVRNIKVDEILEKYFFVFLNNIQNELFWGNNSNFSGSRSWDFISKKNIKLLFPKINNGLIVFKNTKQNIGIIGIKYLIYIFENENNYVEDDEKYFPFVKDRSEVFIPMKYKIINGFSNKDFYISNRSKNKTFISENEQTWFKKYLSKK